MGQTEPHFLSVPMSDRKKFSSTLRNIYKKQHGARPCVEKIQLIFFVPPNEELEGTLHPQQFGCTPKNEGKRVHVPPDKKTCGHAGSTLSIMALTWSDEDMCLVRVDVLKFVQPVVKRFFFISFNTKRTGHMLFVSIVLQPLLVFCIS